jgi:hypothetical protein
MSAHTSDFLDKWVKQDKYLEMSSEELNIQFKKESLPKNDLGSVKYRMEAVFLKCVCKI